MDKRTIDEIWADLVALKQENIRNNGGTINQDDIEYKNEVRLLMSEWAGTKLEADNGKSE